MIGTDCWHWCLLGRKTEGDYIKEVYLRFEVHSQSELIHRFAESDGGDRGIINGAGI